MKNKTITVSRRIISVFICAIFIASVPELFPSFFGDWKCDGRYYFGDKQIGTCQAFGYHNPTWHWGYKHYLLFFMGLFLFIVQVVDVINVIKQKES